MADWNDNGRCDPTDAFLDAETFEIEERRGRRTDPVSLRRVVSGLLEALFWLVLLALVVLFF